MDERKQANACEGQGVSSDDAVRFALDPMRVVHRPSPAISFVGRHNSGKTTLLVQVIAALSARGINVASIKHHGHADFDVDYPGKDSYRHREAGSRDVVVVSPVRMARITELSSEVECSDIVETMPDHDIIIVEGYRNSGLPAIEVMRSGNDRDLAAVAEYREKGSIRGVEPIAFVTDIPEVCDLARARGLRVFDINDVEGVAQFLVDAYVRPRLTVCIQAGGESRRMGQSKSCVPFLGRPLMMRIVERMAPAADELIITTNEPERLTFLDALELPCKLRLVRDVYDSRGALKGLYTAMSEASHPLVAMVACDMIFASPRLTLAEAHTLHMEGCDAVVPQNQYGFEPFHGVYRKKAALAAIEQALSQGCVAAKDMLLRLDVRPFTNDEVALAEPERGCFINANTPNELARIEEMIRIDGDR